MVDPLVNCSGVPVPGGRIRLSAMCDDGPWNVDFVFVC
jgi:hypothetical protein